MWLNTTYPCTAFHTSTLNKWKILMADDSSTGWVWVRVGLVLGKCEILLIKKQKEAYKEWQNIP